MNFAKWVDQRGQRASRTVGQAVELLRSQPGGPRVGVPFRFIDRQGIYESLDHPTINAAIDRAPVRDVPIASLHGIQHTVSKDRVEQYIRNPRMQRRGTKSPDHGGLIDLPIVVKWQDRNLVYDGHHRATAEAFRGGRLLEARFVDLDALRPSGGG